MPIWQLDPIDTEDPNWEASTYRGRVIVRAPDEGAARDIAQRAFAKAATRPLGEEVRVAPWRDALGVSAKLIRGEQFDEHGPDTILFPEWAQYELPPSR